MEENIFGDEGPNEIKLPPEGPTAVSRVGSARLELIMATDEVPSDKVRGVLWRAIAIVDKVKWALRKAGY